MSDFDEDDVEGLTLSSEGVILGEDFDEHDEIMYRVGDCYTYLSREETQEVVDYLAERIERDKVNYTLH